MMRVNAKIGVRTAGYVPIAWGASLFQYCLTRLTGASTDARPMCYEQRCLRQASAAR